MITSNETDKILPALFELKKKLKPMTKDSKNPFFKSNYLKLEDLLDNLEPLLIDQGILVSQANEHRHESEYVISRLTHAESGQFVEAEYKIGFVEDSQKQGAKSSYGRRFSLKGLLGLSERDDDGNTASGKSPKSGTSKSPSKPTTGFSGSPNKPESKSKSPSKSSTSSSGFGGGASTSVKKDASASKALAKSAEKPAAKTPARRGSFGG